MSITDTVRNHIASWIDSAHAEQPILAVSHSDTDIQELCDFAIQHAMPGKQSQAGNHPDTIRIVAEKNTITVADIKQLKLTIASRPISGKRIVCIPRAEQLLPESANMLLKTLEESGTTTRFLLGAPAKRSILATIKSRCLILPLAPEQIMDDDIDLPQRIATYSAIRPSSAYSEEELTDIARIMHGYAAQYGSNSALARMALRLKEYYRTQKIPGGNIKLASDILLASLAELRNTIV
ncbi:MAG: hypothetical protein A3E36_03200 [Candidatus Andersenbacteria bacterium RIFCSPHIGHO2_12_FULL_45_11b]|uniref:DNA polymerase III subunit delta n=1 Tax=Candidatus Andersenbacteria bacterium RIFCSPHIGHO2_12_FULL_45_11b TaxID=1797282 RepID=A0A1G1X9C6_9BACT|nr:MAG: hypothetical protein A3E36_03200 [Candidatus Andersenbacteria bacterium RIFCSPHIGHO2_12_FULL_45_11b]